MRSLVPPSSGSIGVVHQGAASLQGPVQRVETAVVYRFPQEKDEIPFRVKINKKNLTLLVIWTFLFILNIFI